MTLLRRILLGICLAGALPVAALPAKPVVNDVTQLNPIVVDAVVTPQTTEEVAELVRKHAGPISIGGGRYSMGGQTATEGTLFLDMRGMNKVVSFEPHKKLITVQAGITWKGVQETIDPKNLSVKVMQSYHNFTVGGALSVNGHGRYIGNGPIISTVRSIKIVLANGDIVTASPSQNRDLFYGAIGGYGALGVICEVTLELADNVKVKRDVSVMPVNDYRRYFHERIRNAKDIVFHNADIYGPDYKTVRTVSWKETDENVTDPNRLRPVQANYGFNRFVMTMISEWPMGFWLRQHVMDPYVYRDNAVVWRNNEASYDVRELEPASRRSSTYVLEEYFIPVDRFDEFIPKMRRVLARHDVNMINISIRHANKDPGSFMAWAKNEVFCFVMYYKQGTAPEDRQQVGVWTREMIDAAASVGGSYYLPYQLHATQEQFHRAYPNADTLFAFKAAYDPDYKFRNKLWDTYYSADAAERALRLKAEQTTDYARPEDQTFLTLPEWFIVFSADEYAEALAKPPSQFPYLQSIRQFWSIRDKVISTTADMYPPNPGYRLMTNVIGVSYSAELLLKWVYEHSIGRLTEIISGRHDLMPNMKVESFIQKVQQDYATFLQTRPWYDYGFYARFQQLWSVDERSETSFIRSFERRVFFSAELLFKSAYSGLIRFATRQTYDAPVPTTWVKVTKDGKSALLPLPRYRDFFAEALTLSQAGWTFVDIAGNKNIVVTVIGPANQPYQGVGKVYARWPILTKASYQRIAVVIPVTEFAEFLTKQSNFGFRLEHAFDY